MTTLSITYRDISELRPYARNARTHSPRQIKQIANSIEHFEFLEPVLIGDDGEIIAGHGRVEAAKLVGMEKVPTVMASHLTPAQKKAYALAANRLAEKAGWDRETLAIEFQNLAELDFQLDLTGFETGEIDLILEEVGEAKRKGGAPEDNVPPTLPGVTVTMPGDVWELGRHRLCCGDARQNKSYEALLLEAKAEFIITDPPYNVPIDGHVCGLGSIRHKDFSMASGEMTSEAFTAFLADTFERLVTYSADGSIHQIFMDWRHMREMQAAGTQKYTCLKNVCIWNKTNAGMGSFYRSKHEMVFVWKSGAAPHINNFELGQHGRTRTNVWDYAGVNTLKPGRMDELAMHPTVKPVELIADAIKDCSHRNGLVLDPFCGSGTILIACESTGRRARALEIEPKFVDVAVRRWQKYTGKTAVLSTTGESFESIEEASQDTALAA